MKSLKTQNEIADLRLELTVEKSHWAKTRNASASHKVAVVANPETRNPGLTKQGRVYMPHHDLCTT